MIMDFFASNPCYTSAEIRGVKFSKSGRERYGDDAIGYVQVKRQNDICIVKARITPEHKVKSKPYHCSFKCDEREEKIIEVKCEDCAAREGGCKHGIALTMWLHRRSEEPSTTSVKCYWAKGKLSSVGTTLKFIKAKDMKPISSKTAATSQDCASPSDFLCSVVTKSRLLNIESQLMLYNQAKPDLFKSLSLHNLICKFSSQSMEGVNADTFVTYCKKIMENSDLEAVFDATIEQADSPLWHELRYGRVTASKIFDAAHCQTEDGSLVENIMGAYSFKETVAIKRGKSLEKHVVAVLEKVENIKIKKCGFILHKHFPIFGVSPDGMTDELVIEIKCPFKNKNFKNYVCNNAPTKKFMAQIQLQMYFAGKKKGMFCLAHEDFESTKKIDVYRVDLDEKYCEDLIEKATNFWKNNIFEKLLPL
nr:unnamed protein product [Callosobruchus analis]